MPLRDHFRPPVSKRSSWEGFHAMWPSTIVQQLRSRLPEGYLAEPRVRLGAFAEPDLAIDTELPEQYEYEVRICDVTEERTLVAAIEFVSPANKDRPEHRNIFVAKCAALLRAGIAVTIVDLVTIRHFNLLRELVQFLGLPEWTDRISDEPIYAASLRWIRNRKQGNLQLWTKPVAVGATLPTLPLWLTETLVVPIDFEASYESACYDLRIT